MTTTGSSYQTASLYVGDLIPNVTEALLFEIFKAVGPVASIRVCRDTSTRRSLGYAYVNFHNVVDAARALDTLNYTPIKGKPCRIMWCQRDPSIRKSGQGNIFIKNLDKSIDNKTLYDTFSTFGNILSCKVVTDAKGNSKGYGFVHYETKEAAEQSIAKVNGMLLSGKIVFVGPFMSRKERQPTDDSDNFTNLYVKHLDPSYAEEDLRRDFGEYGTIQNSVIIRDTKGNIAFVNYENSEQAKRAIENLNGKKIGEKELYVGRAQKRSERENFLRKLREERAQKYQGINLYVKNLDDSINDAKLSEAFAPFGTITSCKVMTDDKGNSKGFGFVCYTSPEDANKALTEMNSKMLNSKPIYVAFAERREFRRAKLEVQYAVRQSRNPAMGPLYPGTPLFYPQQTQRQGFVGYPQGMPVRRWPVQPGQRGPFQPMPNYIVQPNLQGQRQPHRQPRGAQVQQGNGNRSFKYTQNARNQIAPGQPGAAPIGAAGQPPEQPIDGLGAQPLAAPSLASASPEQRKEIIGEQLFPMIESINPQQGPKITGMLLESMEVHELLMLLKSETALREKIDEAVEVLKAHSQSDRKSVV